MYVMYHTMFASDEVQNDHLAYRVMVKLNASK